MFDIPTFANEWCDDQDAKKRQKTEIPAGVTPNIKWVNPVMWSLWICYDCGYEGPIIIDDRSLAEEIRKNYLKAENQNEESE